MPTVYGWQGFDYYDVGLFMSERPGVFFVSGCTDGKIEVWESRAATDVVGINRNTINYNTAKYFMSLISLANTFCL